MAIAVDATAKGASANSYVTQAEATTFLDGRLNVSDWDGASSDEKNRALVSAANRLDQEAFDGYETTAAQRLKWPRTGLADERGDSVDEDTVPERVKDAQCVLALLMLGSDLLADSGLEGFDRVKVGPLDVDPRHQHSAGELPEDVRRELALWLTTPSARNVALERS